MQVQVDSKLLQLVESQSENLVKSVNEALKLWLEQKLTTCPKTNRICPNNQIPCSECLTFTKTN